LESSLDLNIGLWKVSRELTGIEYWFMEGVWKAHGELNIGLWRVLSELIRVEYSTMDNVG
jgi:hypothetical protein